MKHVELLAPAGNYECFLGAINAGADAVYLGAGKFSARAYADNFTDVEICKAILYAHLLKKKVYLTVNTLMKNEEINELFDFLKPFYEAGLDGVIVQDIGAFLFIKHHFPELELHVSTQMTVTGSYGATLLKELGAVRVVPARELSLDEIKLIKEKTGLEIECFIHGAMCYAYSGQCLFSSILGGRSGNRGRCAGPCRLPYKIGNNGKFSKECYPLSLKDMCTLEILPELIEAGIDSFKIEGRMKKAEYAAGVTAIYRKYIDLYYKNGKENYEVNRKDLDKLSALYIRSDIQNGYYHKYNGKEMITLNSPSYNGCDDALSEQIRNTYLTKSSMKKLAIKMEAEFKIGKEATLRIFLKGDKDKSVITTGTLVKEASKAPISLKNVKDSLKKLGDTFYSVDEDDIHICLDENAFYSLKLLNELRREGIEQLSELIVPKRKLNNIYESDTKRIQKKGNNKKEFSILVQTKEQLETLLNSSFDCKILYLEADMLMQERNLSVNDIKRIKERLQNCKIVIALPYICRLKDTGDFEKNIALFETADGVLVRNMESYKFFKDKNFTKEQIFFDAGIYAFNDNSVYYLQSIGAQICIPYELTGKEQRALNLDPEAAKTEKVIYGRIPLMVSANCLAKTSDNCPAKNNIYRLKDRFGTEFPVRMHCKYCYNVMLNSVPLCLTNVYEEDFINTLRLQFTNEKPDEVKKILEFYAGDFIGKKPPVKDYTTGHEKRGVQ